MRHLVIGQRQKAPNFSAFHWSPHDCLITIGQHFVTTRVVHLPKRTETSLITESDQNRANHRTRLCGPCIAAKAGYVISKKTIHAIKMKCQDCNNKGRLNDAFPQIYSHSVCFLSSFSSHFFSSVSLQVFICLLHNMKCLLYPNCVFV